eukprot:TRINITY_DN53238_c0_g1_i1.p1 TRINITY_DN53238_c0_g1~~TRINITY_DN53238_c0_g1_i1.p1  ORF type:complete len:418 (+),score=107.22 TRINITY_DN53238_c0_g1_i1:111-1364(+)
MPALESVIVMEQVRKASRCSGSYDEGSTVDELPEDLACFEAWPDAPGGLWNSPTYNGFKVKNTFIAEEVECQLLEPHDTIRHSKSAPALLSASAPAITEKKDSLKTEGVAATFPCSAEAVKASRVAAATAQQPTHPVVNNKPFLQLGKCLARQSAESPPPQTPRQDRSITMETSPLPLSKQHHAKQLERSPVGGGKMRRAKPAAMMQSPPSTPHYASRPLPAGRKAQDSEPGAQSPGACPSTPFSKGCRSPQHSLSPLMKGGIPTPPRFFPVSQAAGTPEQVTTFMVQQLSKSYTQDALLADLTAAGFGPGRLDFLYLPWNLGQRQSQGYAFLNFADSMTAGIFAGRFDGVLFGRYASELRISAADRQGRAANVEGLQRTCSKINNPRYLPLILENGSMVAMPRTRGGGSSPASPSL